MIEPQHCEKCETQEVFLRKKGNATGIYCLSCGKWYKWVGKKDIKEYQHKGYKVYNEDYVPAELNQVNTVPNPNATTNKKIGEAFDPRKHGHPEIYEMEEEYYNDDEVDLEEEIKSSNRLTNSNSKGVREDDHCQTCISGVIDPLDKTSNIQFSISHGVMNVRTKDATKLYGSFKMTYCPSCGRRL